MICLLLIGYIISVAIYEHFSDGSVLSLNFYLGVLAWLYVCYDRLIKRNPKNFFVFYLLIFGVFNIFIFSAFIFTFGSVNYYKTDNFVIAFLGINPFFVLIIFIYFLFNAKVLIAFFYTLKNGTDKEIALNFESKIKFYYEKFNLFESENLNDIYRIYKEYPKEAQIALKKIHEERELNYLEF